MKCVGIQFIYLRIYLFPSTNVFTVYCMCCCFPLSCFFSYPGFSYHVFLHPDFLYPGFIQGFLQGLIIGLPYPGYLHILSFPFFWFISLSFHTTSLIVYHVKISKRRKYIVKYTNYMLTHIVKIC